MLPPIADLGRRGGQSSPSRGLRGDFVPASWRDVLSPRSRPDRWTPATDGFELAAETNDCRGRRRVRPAAGSPVRHGGQIRETLVRCALVERGREVR